MRYLVAPGSEVQLDRFDPRAIAPFPGDKDEGRRELAKLTGRLAELQELLFAEHAHAVLIVLQGMDSAGKDGTIRRVFEGVNPQGVRVVSYKVPTGPELDHDYLWRVHAQVPGRGEMVLFNRSHYEDVLVPRVLRTIPRSAVERRFREINEFERMLTEEGTTVLKFFLHISRREQKRRFQERLDDPTKHWKFRRSDLLDRRKWDAFQKAYEDVLSKTSTEWAPWQVVPSDHRWYRDWVVSDRIVRTLERLKMRYPPLPVELRGARIR